MGAFPPLPWIACRMILPGISPYHFNWSKCRQVAWILSGRQLQKLQRQDFRSVWKLNNWVMTVPVTSSMWHSRSDIYKSTQACSYCSPVNTYSGTPGIQQDFSKLLMRFQNQAMKRLTLQMHSLPIFFFFLIIFGINYQVIDWTENLHLPISPVPVPVSTTRLFA